MKATPALFEKLRKHGLTLNLKRSEFGRATVKYLSYVVGQGQILPEIQVNILKFLTPKEKWVGLIGSLAW